MFTESRPSPEPIAEQGEERSGSVKGPPKAERSEPLTGSWNGPTHKSNRDGSVAYVIERDDETVTFTITAGAPGYQPSRYIESVEWFDARYMAVES